VLYQFQCMRKCHSQSYNQIVQLVKWYFYLIYYLSYIYYNILIFFPLKQFLYIYVVDPTQIPVKVFLTYLTNLSINHKSVIVISGVTRLHWSEKQIARIDRMNPMSNHICLAWTKNSYIPEPHFYFYTVVYIIIHLVLFFVTVEFTSCLSFYFVALMSTFLPAQCLMSLVDLPVQSVTYFHFLLYRKRKVTGNSNRWQADLTFR
jgi:hypothetical protein